MRRTDDRRLHAKQLGLQPGEQALSAEPGEPSRILEPDNAADTGAEEIQFRKQSGHRPDKGPSVTASAGLWPGLGGRDTRAGRRIEGEKAGVSYNEP
ncbi:hypothetical protein EYF80_049981 [Liparis tanakae]|uniref:Uncharacterized protein n=1 Tax=Liparis tanakae TaxID=230148 RepID=A0A4Z2FF68_9TELE|nr:hypothetical protein EYF80_049981 [Liparis tanakae]